jgi:hypothetical protein
MILAQVAILFVPDLVNAVALQAGDAKEKRFWRKP